MKPTKSSSSSGNAPGTLSPSSHCILTGPRSSPEPAFTSEPEGFGFEVSGVPITVPTRTEGSLEPEPAEDGFITGSASSESLFCGLPRYRTVSTMKQTCSSSNGTHLRVKVQRLPVLARFGNLLCFPVFSLSSVGLTHQFQANGTGRSRRQPTRRRSLSVHTLSVSLASIIVHKIFTSQFDAFQAVQGPGNGAMRVR